MEHPDGACNRCKLPVGHEQWKMIGESVYHTRCMACGICKKHYQADKFTERGHMVFCHGCDKKSDQVQELIAQWKHDATSRKCSMCESTAAGTRVLRAGKVYCGNCYRCFNCYMQMGTDNCYLLIDRLYCYNCETLYRMLKYQLSKSGSGPQMLRLMRGL